MPAAELSDADVSGTPAVAVPVQAAAPSFPSVAPRYLQPGESGYSAGSDNPMTNLSPGDYARFNAGQGPVAAPPAAEAAAPAPASSASAPVKELSDDEVFGAPSKTDYVANLAAGGNAAIASTLGLPVDLATGGINLATRGINAIAGTDIPPIVDPVGGSGTFKRAMGVVGANPDDVRPDGVGQEIARGVGGGIVSAVAPEAALGGLVRAGAVAAPAAAKIVSALGGATPENALLGAASGGASEAAASQVSDPYKPYAALAGGMAGVGLPLAAVAGARGAVRAAGDYLAPMVGQKAPLSIYGSDGQPINALAGGPLVATPNVQRLAGEKLLAGASDPDALAAKLAQPDSSVPGFQPTTAQLSNDPNLLATERAISRLPAAQGPYQQRAAQQNDALVGAVRNVAPGADPAAVSTHLQGQAAASDTAAAARIAQVQSAAAEHVAQTEATHQARIAGLQQTADQARTAVGGDLPGPDPWGDAGRAVRASIDAANQAAKKSEDALWDAIDPDGKLAVDMRPVRNGAKSIVGNMPSNAAPLAGNEAAIFKTASKLPDVQSFRELAALRKRLTNAIRQERGPQGDPEAVRRMSMLLGHVHSAMEDGAVANAASDARAVANGTMAPDQTTVARLRSGIKTWDDEVDAASAQRVPDGSGDAGQHVRGGEGAISPLDGAADQGGGQHEPVGPGFAGGTGGIPAGATAEVAPRADSGQLQPNFDADAQARYAAARQATADRAALFKSPPGVREALQGGPQAGTFRLADSSIPATMIRVGPVGRDVALAYLKAGGDPQALTDAAAFSLRRAAARPDGTLDPGDVAKWADARASFLSVLPDARAKFGAAAEAQAALDAGTKDAADALKQATAAAQKTVDAATAAQAEAVKARQKSAIGRFLGENDPVTQVAAILRTPTSVADMRRVAQAVSDDPDAKAGLQAAIAQHILDNLKGNAGRAGGVEDALKSDQLQTFIRSNDKALREVLTPEQMASLGKVAEGLHQANLSVSGSKLQGGSDTMQIAAKGVGEAPQSFLANLQHQAVTHAGTTIGGGLGFVFGGGPIGAIAGAAVGRGGDWVVNAARASHAAGIRNVEDLVGAAMLHPQLAAVLLTKVTPQNRSALGSALIKQLQRITLVSGTVGRSDQRQHQPPQNALLH